MATLSTEQKIGLISLVLVISGVVIADNMEQSYYCEPEDNVKECLRLSSSGITCYYLAAEDLTKGDRCTNGRWESLEPFVKPVESDDQQPTGEVVKVSANAKEWICQTDNGFVDPYTYCTSGKFEGYLGEFI